MDPSPRAQQPMLDSSTMTQTVNFRMFISLLMSLFQWSIQLILLLVDGILVDLIFMKLAKEHRY